MRLRDLLDGWRFILAHRELRLLFFNRLAFNGLVMATEPVLAVLMLGTLRFAPWQYSLAFAVPCTGGLIGSRLSRPLVDRLGQRRVMLVAGTLRSCWPIWLVFMGPGVAGVVVCIVVEFGLITCISAFSPVVATYQLQQLPADRVARALSAWTVSSSVSIAGLTALWGGLATLTGPRAGIGIAGALLLTTPLLLPGAMPPGVLRVLSPASAGRRHGRDDAAVHEEVNPVEEAGVVGQGVADDLRDLLGAAHPAQRGHGEHLPDDGVDLGLLAALGRVDEPRRQGDDPGSG